MKVYKSYGGTFNRSYSKADDKHHRSKELAAIIKQIIDQNSQLRDEIVFIKLATNVIESDELLQNFVENTRALKNSGVNVIILHDYAGLISSTLDLFGIDHDFVNKMQFGDPKTSQIIEMVISGYINKRIVSALCSAGCNAIGISGKDGGLIEARRSLMPQTAGNESCIEFGFVGYPVGINTEILQKFIESNVIPVISPIALGINGSTYLLDVYLTSAMIASDINAKHLVFMTELGGVSINDEVVPMCTVQKLKQVLKSGELSYEYNKILNAAQKALHEGTEVVYIADSEIINCILLTMFTNSSSTKIVQ